MNIEKLSKWLGQKVLATTNLKKFKNQYDQTIAKVQLSEFGKIYYYEKTLDPVELEDLYSFLENQKKYLTNQFKKRRKRKWN